jgi:hypothetical protein
MCAQSAAQEDPAAAVIPEVRPRTPWRIAAVQALDGFCLRVRFLDGLEGVVKMSGLVHSPDAGVFSRLADPAVFSQASVVHGAVTWPGEIDLAPDAMYQAIRDNGEWVL